MMNKEEEKAFLGGVVFAFSVVIFIITKVSGF